MTDDVCGIETQQHVKYAQCLFGDQILDNYQVERYISAM